MMLPLPPGFGGEPTRPRLALRVIAFILVGWGALLAAITGSPWCLLIIAVAMIATFVF